MYWRNEMNNVLIRNCVSAFMPVKYENINEWEGKAMKENIYNEEGWRKETSKASDGRLLMCSGMMTKPDIGTMKDVMKAVLWNLKRREEKSDAVMKKYWRQHYYMLKAYIGMAYVF